MPRVFTSASSLWFTCITWPHSTRSPGKMYLHKALTMGGPHLARCSSQSQTAAAFRRLKCGTSQTSCLQLSMGVEKFGPLPQLKAHLCSHFISEQTHAFHALLLSLLLCFHVFLISNLCYWKLPAEGAIGTSENTKREKKRKQYGAARIYLYTTITEE